MKNRVEVKSIQTQMNRSIQRFKRNIRYVFCVITRFAAWISRHLVHDRYVFIFIHIHLNWTNVNTSTYFDALSSTVLFILWLNFYWDNSFWKFINPVEETSKNAAATGVDTWRDDLISRCLVSFRTSKIKGTQGR